MKETAIQLSAAALIPLLGWLWAKARGKKAARLDEMFTDMTEGLVHELAATGVTMTMAESVFETRLLGWAETKLHLDKHSKSTQWLVHEFVAYGMRKLAEYYHEKTQPITTERLLKAITAAASATVTKFDPPPPEKRTVPVLQIPIQEIKPE